MRPLITTLLLLLLAAKTAAIVARGPVSIEMDAAQYWRLSASVMSGDLLLMGDRIAFRTPGYPWFLASIRSAAGADALFWTAAIQGILSLLSTWIAARLSVRITRLPRALPITLLVSLPCVSALVFNAAILSETLFVFLLMMNLSAVQRYVDRESVGSTIWLGVTFALTLLTRPIVLLLWIPHVMFIALIHWRRSRLRHRQHNPRIALQRVSHSARLMHLLIIGAVVLSSVSPWLIRNQVMFGKPFLTEFVGRNLWIVTFQDGSCAGLPIPNTDAGQTLTRRLDRVGVTDDRELTWTVSGGLIKSGLSDPQADQLMKRVAIDAIRQAPTDFVVPTLSRVLNFWRTRATELPQQGNRGQFFGQHVWQYDLPLIDQLVRFRASNILWANTLMMFVIAAGIVVLVVHSPTRPAGIWILLMMAYFSVITGVFEIPAYRYRMVIEPLSACVIGSAAAILLSKRTKPAIRA
ncbi:hypothetical protein [Rubripirellula lacrimiformis]|uniref:hypothetical protein n=1 Tax=Rubripirellula lacrimiformis TaxID=1930273 RepID=UPI0011A4F56C|nr:hypothetical protein [Rubripirellula lacrimiformis]